MRVVLHMASGFPTGLERKYAPPRKPVYRSPHFQQQIVPGEHPRMHQASGDTPQCQTDGYIIGLRGIAPAFETESSSSKSASN